MFKLRQGHSKSWSKIISITVLVDGYRRDAGNTRLRRLQQLWFRFRFRSNAYL